MTTTEILVVAVVAAIIVAAVAILAIVSLGASQFPYEPDELDDPVDEARRQGVL